MMNLRWDNNTITFIIDTLHSIGFESKGASIACHKLAYELANQGHYVYVFNEPFFPHSNIKVIPVEKKNGLSLINFFFSAKEKVISLEKT